MQTKQLLRWGGMTDTEHTIPVSNEEEKIVFGRRGVFHHS